VVQTQRTIDPFYDMSTSPVLAPNPPSAPASARSSDNLTYVDRPLRQSGAIALPARAVAGAEALPPILVADDDEDDRFFIQRLIIKTGVSNPVRTFDDGSEVVNFLGGARRMSALHPRSPLLLFLDLKMHGLGGIGFLEWARREKDLAPLTIVVLSNSAEAPVMAQALELGAHRYLVKYPSVQTINTIVRSVYPLTVF
jgi:CheY-like chemotaxis protein